jgi:N-acetyl-anhydromuramyl-L-alanine amidase AmpD
VYSELIEGIVPANKANYAKGRTRYGVTYSICKITPHHMSGRLSAQRCGEIFQNPSRGASSNYGIGYDGKIYGYVDEEDRAWTSSN